MIPPRRKPGGIETDVVASGGDAGKICLFQSTLSTLTSDLGSFSARLSVRKRGFVTDLAQVETIAPAKIGRSYSMPSERHYLAILTEEAAKASVPMPKVLSRSRRKPIVRVRQRAWKRLSEAGYGPAGIGRRAGYHYSAVISGLKTLARVEVT